MAAKKLRPAQVPQPEKEVYWPEASDNFNPETRSTPIFYKNIKPVAASHSGTK